MARSSSVPRSRPFARRCSRTRVEKKRSRDSSKQIPVRSSINMRISLSSCPLSPCPCPCRSLIALPFSGPRSYYRPRGEEEPRCLSKSACRDRPLGMFICCSRFGGSTELCQRFVQLIRQLDELAYGCHCPARSLRRLPRNARNDLHGVRDSFCSAHLLFRRQRDFLYEFRRLAHHVGNGVQRAACLIGKSCATLHFLRAFFHDHDRFVRLRLNCLDQRCDIFRRAAAVFGKLADFVGDDRKASARLARACCLDGRVQCQEVRLFRKDRKSVV